MFTNTADLSEQLSTFVSMQESRKSVSRSCIENWRGIILCACSALINSGTAYIANHLIHKEGYSPFQVNLSRFLGMCIFSCIHVLILELRKNPIVTHFLTESFQENKLSLLFVLLRCCFGITTMLLQYLALKFITPAEVSLVIYSNSLLIILVARVVLKEPLTIFRILASVISIFGVYITTRPAFIFGEPPPYVPDKDGIGASLPASEQHMTGLGIAGIAALASTGTVITLRLVRGIHFAAVTATFGCLGCIVSLILVGSLGDFSRKEHPSFHRWALHFTVAVSNWACINILTLAFRYEKAGPLGVIRSSEIALLFLWQLTDSYPHISSLIGGSIVIFTCFLVGLQNYVATTPENSKVRRSLGIVLK